MHTYRYRLRFFVHAKGVITHPEKRYDLKLPNGTKALLSTLDAESIGEGKELVISGGGFKTEESACSIGKVVKDSVLMTGVKLRIGVDTGKEKTSGWVNPTIKNEVLNNHGVRIINDVHGLSVYSEEYPVKIFSTSGPTIFCPSNAEKFSSELCNYFSATLSDKQRLALELYGASHYEKSDRARFLTLILCAEALLEPSARSDKERELIDSLVNFIKDADIGNEERQSILGSLMWLYKQSISQSLRKMAEEHLGGKTYDKLPAAKFITVCYEARSTLVHTGGVNESQVNIGVLAAQLNIYLSDLLLSLVAKNGT
jgi:hypothetical protein